MAESPKESCLSCVFYLAGSNRTGYCMRYPPTVFQKGVEVAISPSVGAGIWCGEYRKKAEKENDHDI